MTKAQNMVPLKQYAVISLHHVSTEDTTRLFLLPGTVMEFCIESAIKDGYEVRNVLLCGEDQYLNAKVDNCVDDFLDIDREVKHLKSEFSCGKLSMKDYMDALEITDELKRTTAKILYSVMRRLQRKGFTCTNEQAKDLYNYYFKA